MAITQDQARRGPRRQRHHAYDESINEPAATLEDEPTEIEEEIPAEEREPIESADESDEPDSPTADT